MERDRVIHRQVSFKDNESIDFVSFELLAGDEGSFSQIIKLEDDFVDSFKELLDSSMVDPEKDFESEQKGFSCYVISNEISECHHALIQIKNDKSSHEKVRCDFPEVSFRVAYPLWSEITKILVIEEKWEAVADRLGYRYHDIKEFQSSKNYKTSAEAFIYTFGEQNGMFKDFVLSIIYLEMWSVFTILFDNNIDLREIFGHKCNSDVHSNKINIRMPSFLKNLNELIDNVDISSSKNGKKIFLIWSESSAYDYFNIKVIKQIFYECGYLVHVLMDGFSEKLIVKYMQHSDTILIWWTNQFQNWIRLSSWWGLSSLLGLKSNKYAIFRKISELLKTYENKILSLHFEYIDAQNLHLDLIPNSKSITYKNRESFRNEVMQLLDR